MRQTTSADITMTLPYYCDDCETWHKQFVWCHDDPLNPYTICDEDGDHEACDEADLPTIEEHDKAWLEYARWVVEHGQDPLDNYYVKPSRAVRERWQIRVNDSVAGPILLAARRDKRTYRTAAELPVRMREYLNLKRMRLADFATWAELESAQPGIKPGKWWTILLDTHAMRSEFSLARELRKAARSHLREKGEAA